MRVFAFLLVLCAVAAFRPVRFGAPIQRQGVLTRLADSPKYEIVPVEKETVESAASVSGAIVGFLLAGPIGSLLGAAMSNWLVKKDTDGGEALRGVGKAVVDAYNYINKMNSKLNVTGKLGTAIGDAVEKASSESESAAKFSEIKDKAVAVIEEYDLTTKAVAFAKASVELTTQAVEKADELNSKYDFVNTAIKTASDTVNAAVEKSKSN
jgi:hypothetical protein